MALVENQKSWKMVYHIIHGGRFVWDELISVHEATLQAIVNYKRVKEKRKQLEGKKLQEKISELIIEINKSYGENHLLEHGCPHLGFLKVMGMDLIVKMDEKLIVGVFEGMVVMEPKKRTPAQAKQILMNKHEIMKQYKKEKSLLRKSRKKEKQN